MGLASRRLVFPLVRYNRRSPMRQTQPEPLTTLVSELVISRGRPLPLGATPFLDGINFSIFSRDANAVSLLLYRPGENHPFAEVPFDIRFNRTGEIWHAFIRGVTPGTRYGYVMDRQPH